MGCYVAPGGSLMGNGPRDNKTMDRESMGRRFGGTGRVSWGANDSILGGGETTFVAPNLMPDYTQRGGGSGGTGGTSGGSQGGQGALQTSGGGGGGGGVFERRYADVKRTNTRMSGDYNNRNNGDYHRNNDFSRNNSDYSRNNGNEFDRGRFNGMNGGMSDNRRHRNNSDNRNHNNHHDSEPEWWSEGPTSQNDVIELRGFYDDDTKEGSGSSPDSRKNSESERVQRKSSSSSGGGGEGSNSKELADSGDQGKSGDRNREKTNSGNTVRDTPLGSFGNAEPNIDDLLNNLDTIFTNNSEPVSTGDPSSAGGGSRFSRWFRSESPAGPQQSAQSPSPHHMINDIINDITEERPPSAQQNQHARYSPVSHHPRAGLPAGANFLNMMLKQTQEGGALRSTSIRDLEGVGKLHSVEELEAKMRPSNGPASAGGHHNNPLNKEEDMANFKKLLAKSIDVKKTATESTTETLATPTPLVPPSMGATVEQHSSTLNSSSGPDSAFPSGTDPAMLPQMMTKLLQQQHHLAQNMHQQAQLSGVTPGGHHLPHHAAGPWANLLAQQNRIDQEIVHKIVKIQQAQEYQRRMAALGLGPQPAPGGAPQAGYLPTSPLPPEVQHHLLNNPQFDARNLIRPTPGVGPLSPSQAQSQLNGPPPPLAGPMTPGGPSFLQTGGGPPNHPMGPSGAQQFLLGTPPPGAPSPGNSSVFQQQQQRIPSPNQLAAHTQAILQNAILKKKLQEQKETLRKRQEQQFMQRSSSPSPQPNAHELRPSQSSPNVINAFTPTSVLRKMTAHPHPHDQTVPASNQHEK
ncbi:hypothetical protein WDU94_009900, partial [Cyamophila willieti]